MACEMAYWGSTVNQSQSARISLTVHAHIYGHVMTVVATGAYKSNSSLSWIGYPQQS